MNMELVTEYYAHYVQLLTCVLCYISVLISIDLFIIVHHCSGVSRISFRGGSNYFWKSGGICMAQSAWRSHAFARGVRGHAPPRKFLKIVQFGAF